MANFANPTVGSNYTDFPAEIRASVNAALQQLSVGSHTNIPTGAIKFDTSANRWKKFNGSAFVDLTASYDLNAVVSVNELQLESDEKIRLGNSQEFEFFHNSSNNNSIIRENGSGFFSIQTNGSQISFYDIPNNAIMAEFNTGGACILKHGGNTKLQTNTNGIQITNSLGIGGATSNSLEAFGNVVQFGASNTSDQQLRVGRSGSGNRNAYIDLIGDNTYSTSGFRIIRTDAGANTQSQLIHRGTGDLVFNNFEAANMTFKTSNNTKARLTAAGRLGIGTTNPLVNLVVRGSTPRITLEPTADTQTCRYQFARTDGSVLTTVQSGGSLGTALKFNNLTTEVFRVDTNARIGLGTTSPVTKLDVADSSGLGILSRSTGTQQTDTNKAIRVRNNSTTDTFNVSYRGATLCGFGLTVGRLSPTWTGSNAITGTSIFAHSGTANTTSPSYITIASGNASNSGIVFGDTDDIDVGKIFYSHSNNSLRFDTNTSEKFRIMSDGKIGIGTSQPTEEITIEGATPAIMLKDTDLANSYIQLSAGNGDMFLSANDTQHNGQFFFRSGLNGTFTERARINNLGRLGLGISNPSSLLHLIGTQTVQGGAFSNNVSTGNKDFTASIDIQATSMRGGIVVRNMNDFRSTSAFNASYMHYDPYDTTATSFAFRVARGATLADTFTVRSDGRTYVGEKLGVGTSSPERLLHVVGSDCRIKLSDSDVTADVELQNSSGNGVLTTNASTHLIFMNNNTERVRIDSTGRLMVNRTSADFHLDVSGAARITDHIYLSNGKRVIWGTSNSSFIQGDDNDYLLFGVNNEVFRINGTALRIGQTTTDFAGAGNTTVGSSITKTGRVHSSTSDHQTGFTANANTSSTSKHFCSFRRNGTQIGSIKQETGGVSYNTTSDRRLKENIVDIKNALLTLLKLKPKEYNWKSDKNKVSEHGFIAQDLLEDKLCEYAVAHLTDEETGEDSYGMDYGRLTAITIAAIQELAGKVSDLESKLA